MTTLINAPLFILFAEFMGYESPLLSWAEDVCEGKEIEESHRKFIEIDAICIYHDMQKKFSIEDIKKQYHEVSSVLLTDYISQFNNPNDGLPF